ncbi:MAG: Low affinity potassium transport system protein kup [Candidatus Dichloromethanomonas elyunquensis]|nr:MAG: Low affinity potassium transport system protein kup [Candidatus Dichloromethanomonas elyunquensis]
MAHTNKMYWLKVRTMLFGHPLASHQTEHAKVGVFGGIPIFGSDIISSEGYAPDAILNVLLLVGVLGYAYVMRVSLVIILILASVTLVYRRAIQKYPQGGGSYTIAKAYLGENFGLIAGASLTMDYVLTVAVSVSSAIENLSGIFPWLIPHKVLADCFVILFMAWINLRGLKESARLFALPVYLYILSLILLIGTGLVKVLVYGVTPSSVVMNHVPAATVSGMTLFLFLRAIAAGITALTGLEAVSNGVTAFKNPSQKHAIQTLLILAGIVAAGLVGLVLLAGAYHIVPSDYNTVLNQLGMIIFGHTLPYYILMSTVAAILIIASNTPFAGLPILMSLMAKDNYVPRYFKNLGDRLVYSVGIWFLCIISIFLIVIFHGHTQAMLPLYAIGVLLCFSLTGLGLARHTREVKAAKWIPDFMIFTFGGVVCFIVFLIFIVTKFTEGAWIVLIVLPLLIMIFKTIAKIYRKEIVKLEITPEAVADFKREIAIVNKRRAHSSLAEYRNKIIIPVYDLNLIVLKALKYAYSLTPQVTAVHIASEQERANKILKHWSEYNIEVPLDIVQSPYRSTVKDFISYLDRVEKNSNFQTITVVVPEFVPLKFWHNILHNQTGQHLKLLLLYRKNILITSVPYHPGDENYVSN